MWLKLFSYNSSLCTYNYRPFFITTAKENLSDFAAFLGELPSLLDTSTWMPA